MIDLRSDTVTVPSDEMRRYMMYAQVGDDVYGEDPTINALQEKTAELFGKEAALFVPSGTMSNQISLKVLTNPADEVIIEADAHVFYYETAAPAVISNVQFFTIPSESGEIPLDKIEKAIRPDIYYFPKTKAIFVENTHNRHGGTVISIDYIKSLRELADKYGLYLHLDGARIWNAHIASGVSLEEYGKYFDTISVCLSKGMGAPAGSLMVSDASKINGGLKWRKILGGGMRQAGILAAAGIFAIENNLQLIADDHIRTRRFAKAVAEMDSVELNLESVQTNMAVFKLDDNILTSDFVNECRSRGLLLSEIGDNKIRTVFHLQISDIMTDNAIDIIYESIKTMLGEL
ncbi:MAG: aminotransferase class I/II-fold pyridoxal phosphate-dependent enzyme [Candidatus Kapabacteria bacterium]|nr:aminotransferase class I/II-fold pyridoxal phosphate-dependent enzyme [Ignavibacteriota bacterium]MCW5885384.1 aminotransferase class I/II-fold pyridoxal phosphate-dependent enzyme [Candidatus Kapabacteria bacterium]